MQTIFEAMGGTYRQEDDYLLPNIEAPESPQIGIWGQRGLQYLRTSKRVLYTTMLMGGTLKDHLSDGFKELENFLETLPLDDNNAVFNLCCRLCGTYEHKAFLDGLQYGAHLMQEIINS